MTRKFSATALLNAHPDKLWTVLTDLELMAQWLGEPDMNVVVATDWKLNSPISIRGFHHGRFENQGIVLRYDRERFLSYTHLSSASRLADKPENHTVIEFELSLVGNQTELTITIENFPTEVIQKHLEFYWGTTILTIKRVAETTTLHC